MKSHEYADKLMEIVRLLQTSPEFEMPQYYDSYIADYGTERLLYWSDKEGFIAAVRALGSGKKIYRESEIEFKPNRASIHLQVSKDAVCKIVKPAVPAVYEGQAKLISEAIPAVYECEPLLSPEEEAEVGQ